MKTKKSLKAYNHFYINKILIDSPEFNFLKIKLNRFWFYTI